MGQVYRVVDTRLDRSVAIPTEHSCRGAALVRTYDSSMHRSDKRSGAWFFIVILCLSSACRSSNALPPPAASARHYDVAIINGRVIDPESGLDAIRNVGVVSGRIETITQEAISGDIVIDGKGLVVAPGFIDLHQHSLEYEVLRLKALDGVTAAFDMEFGAGDVDEWYATVERRRSPIHFGAAISHPMARAAVLTGALPQDATGFVTGEASSRAATDEEIVAIRDHIRRGLQRGAVGVGIATGYTPGATPWEIIEVFRTAAEFSGAPVHVHVRDTDRPQHWMETAELVLATVVSGAPLHIVHANSSYGGDAPKLFAMIDAARARGLDVTTEAYPYTAAMTSIKAAPFDDWETWSDERFARFIWPPTGERLTRESFGRYRAEGGMVVIEGSTEEKLRPALASPLTMIVSDGGMVDGVAHPRLAGTYARVLGKYVREEKLLTLIEALRKMTLMPAQRLERRVPAMRNKGRIRVGADADLTIFDPATVIDRATFREPLQPSAGIRYVIVGGALAVEDGSFNDAVAAGRPIRAEAAGEPPATSQ